MPENESAETKDTAGIEGVLVVPSAGVTDAWTSVSLHLCLRRQGFCFELWSFLLHFLQTEVFELHLMGILQLGQVTKLAETVVVLELPSRLVTEDAIVFVNFREGKIRGKVGHFRYSSDIRVVLPDL